MFSLFVLSFAAAQSEEDPFAGLDAAIEDLGKAIDGTAAGRLLAWETDPVYGGPGMVGDARIAELKKRCEGDCVSGKGTLAFDDGVKWVGTWSSGYPNGSGTLTAEGASYVGEVAKGMFEGQGKLTQVDGSWHEGAWKAGQRHGPGKGVDGSGLQYEVVFAADAMAGPGFVVLPDGSKIAGTFGANGPTQAKATWPNGESWTGAFQQWQPNGWGAAEDGKGASHEVRFENGKPVEKR